MFGSLMLGSGHFGSAFAGVAGADTSAGFADGPQPVRRAIVARAEAMKKVRMAKSSADRKTTRERVCRCCGAGTPPEPGTVRNFVCGAGG